MRKKFDRQLYDQNDNIAKTKVTEILKDYVVKENPRKRDVDLLIYDKDGNHLFNVEAERKLVWQGRKFPYDNVQIAGRKRKYAELDKPTYFIMFNETWDSYLVIKHTDLLASPLKVVSNKYVRFGEEFFQVPLDKITFNEFKE
jgi:hypothetical protein